MTDIAAIILTYNEEKHIERCIASIRGVCREIFVIDSLSTDRTVELALAAGATQVLQNPWKNYATQFNWGIEHAPITAGWLWRIDADEYIEPALARAVEETIGGSEVLRSEGAEGDEPVNGIYVRKRIDFMGRPLRHGGWYPQYHLKLWRRGHGACENRWMDEHIRLTDGRTLSIDLAGADQVDANLNDLTWWTQKHNGYATREMVDMLMLEYGMDDGANEIRPRLFGSGPERKRWLKLRYVKSPLFVRPFLNFVLRYVFKGGLPRWPRGLRVARAAGLLVPDAGRCQDLRDQTPLRLRRREDQGMDPRGIQPLTKRKATIYN